MRYAIVVGWVAATLCGREQATGQERGILSFKAVIVKVHDKSLELALVDRNEDVPRGQAVRFDVVKDTRFEEVDFKLVGGKLETTRKAIKLGDLLPTQSINVIAVAAGDRRTLLVGVVLGGRASGAEALKLIAKLGGALHNFAWRGDHRYEVDLSNSKVTDDALALIASMDDLIALNLTNTKITDEGSPRFGNFGAQWHGLGTRCLRFARWVARKGRKTRFWLLAALPGGIGYPQSSYERFP